METVVRTPSIGVAEIVDDQFSSRAELLYGSERINVGTQKLHRGTADFKMNRKLETFPNKVVPNRYHSHFFWNIFECSFTPGYPSCSDSEIERQQHISFLEMTTTNLFLSNIWKMLL